MINLRKQLNIILKSIHPDKVVGGKNKSRVHFQNASKDTPYIYVVYDLPNSFPNEEQEIFTLDIDIWDKPINGDTTELEILASTIWKELNNYRYLDDDIQFSIYRSNRLPQLNDDDPAIKRRKLIFELRYFDRKL